ncbi:hypothetical protein EVAR_30614_1 [Eumeta japonica]|uniref:Uncharacterized protein n=1 Tax=Eumeta variegata TaxID=151549 RepID=A0A4C1WBK7_EUMVA|nr:hypothetical protein EVAR_30614_1 [Eumeta japonica]
MYAKKNFEERGSRMPRKQCPHMKMLSKLPLSASGQIVSLSGSIECSHTFISTDTTSKNNNSVPSGSKDANSRKGRPYLSLLFVARHFNVKYGRKLIRNVASRTFSALNDEEGLYLQDFVV